MKNLKPRATIDELAARLLRPGTAARWNPTLMDYKIPGVLDTPHDIVAMIVEDPEPTGPFGAKGVGEPAPVSASCQ